MIARLFLDSSQSPDATHPRYLICRWKDEYGWCGCVAGRPTTTPNGLRDLFMGFITFHTEPQRTVAQWQ